MMFTEQVITIYNKYKDSENKTQWHREVLNCTLRNGSLTIKTDNSINTDYNCLVRVYDTSKYVEEQEYDGTGWTCKSGDIVVNKEVDYNITTDSPINELRSKYGAKNVYSINGYDDYRKGTSLDHIKIGLI